MELAFEAAAELAEALQQLWRELLSTGRCICPVCAVAMNIWFRDMSKPAELCCKTVSRPNPCVCTKASTWLRKLPWDKTTPLGTPEVPLVKRTTAGSLARAVTGRQTCVPSWRRRTSRTATDGESSRFSV